VLEAIGRLDVAVFQWLRGSLHSDLLNILLAGVSDIARGGAVWIGLALLIAVMRPRRWPAIVQVLLAIALSFALTDLVAKPLLNRARPFESYADTQVYGYKPTTRSLPSGHATTSFAAAYALARLAPEGRIIFWTLAIVVAFSRVYLGVHYPADVVLGGLMGVGIGMFVVGKTAWPAEPFRR
jgi:undecaprenyl-diphosphatase